MDERLLSVLLFLMMLPCYTVQLHCAFSQFTQFSQFCCPSELFTLFPVTNSLLRLLIRLKNSSSSSRLVSQSSVNISNMCIVDSPWGWGCIPMEETDYEDVSTHVSVSDSDSDGDDDRCRPLGVSAICL